MSKNIYETALEAIAATGSRDPLSAADYLGILPVDISGTILGYAALYNGRYPAIGLNTKLSPAWRMFGGWHEIGHVLCGDIYDSSLQQKGILDTGFFTQELDSKTIAAHEKRANLFSADVCLSDDSIAEVTGYNSPVMQSYRRVAACQEKLLRACQELHLSLQAQSPAPLAMARIKAWQEDLRRLDERKNDLRTEMLSLNCCKSFAEMARELNTTETILRYKLEAMRLRGEDIDRQELERYDQVFKGAV